MTDIPIKEYERQLETFFLSLKEQIQKIPPPTGFELEELEQFVLELNSYYYHSFQQSFLPQYKKKLTEDLKQILHLEQDEKSLRQAVIQLFHAYAEQTRRLNLLARHLENLKSQLHAWKEALVIKELKQKTELYHSLVFLQAELNALLAIFRQSVFFMKSPDVRLALKQFPGHVSLLNLLMHPEISNKKNQRFLQQLLLNLQLQISCLKALDDSKKPAWLHELEALANPSPGFTDKISFWLKNWYQRYYQLQQNNYLLTITALLTKSESGLHKLCIEFEAWLNGLDMIVSSYFNCAFKQVAFYSSSAKPLENLNETAQKLFGDLERWTAGVQLENMPLSVMADESEPLIAGIQQLLTSYHEQQPEWEPLVEQALSSIRQATDHAAFLWEKCRETEPEALKSLINSLLAYVSDQLQQNQTLLLNTKKMLTEKNFKQKFSALTLSLKPIAIEPGYPLSLSAYEYLRLHHPDCLPDSPEQPVRSASSDILILNISDQQAIIFPDILY